MASCLKHTALSAVHHLDFASFHPGGGHSPYRNSVACPEECKHSLSNRYYSCTAHFSTKIVPTDIKKARKRPFYRLLRAFENYSNSIVPGGLLVQSYTTRFTPFTSFTILFVTFPRTSQGSCAASAVMKSLVVTALSATA